MIGQLCAEGIQKMKEMLELLPVTRRHIGPDFRQRGGLQQDYCF